MHSQRWAIAVAIGALVQAGATTNSIEPNRPGGGTSVERFTAVGEPMETTLRRLSAQSGVRLTAARPMQGQRLTLFVTDLTVERFAQDLAQLLTPVKEAPVNWVREREGAWRLDESVNRRRLALSLASEGAGAFKAHIEEQIAWADRQGLQEWAETPPSPKRNFLTKQLSNALFLKHVGEAGRADFMQGKPLIAQIGALPNAMKDVFRERLGSQSGLADLPAEEKDRYSYVYLFGNSPTSPRGGVLWISLVLPKGVMGSRFGEFHMPRQEVNASMIGGVEVPQADPNDTSPRATFNLSPKPETPAGVSVRCDLNQILFAIAQAYGVDVIADGYLRPQGHIAANKVLKDYPRDSLLRFVCALWGCSFRVVGPQESPTILVRAHHWYLEDAADVPEAIVVEQRGKLGPGTKPRLQDLVTLAELSQAQVHKLVESGVCPGASGLIRPGWYEDGSSARPWLQFYGRLSPQLQRQGQAQDGLRLGDAPSNLVKERLGVALLAGFGVIDEAKWPDVRVAFAAHPDAGAVEIRVSLPAGVTRTILIRPAKP
jgi:hypothetical protein